MEKYKDSSKNRDWIEAIFYLSLLRAALETIQEVLKTVEGIQHVTEILGVDDESNSTFIGDFPC